MRVEWIHHNGKKVLFADYSNVKTQEELLEIQKESIRVAREISGTFLSMGDVTNSALGPDFMKEAKLQGKEFKHKMDKSAIIGITGLKGMLLKGFNLFSGDSVKPFATKEEALDYLTS